MKIFRKNGENYEKSRFREKIRTKSWRKRKKAVPLHPLFGNPEPFDAVKQLRLKAVND